MFGIMLVYYRRLFTLATIDSTGFSRAVKHCLSWVYLGVYAGYARNTFIYNSICACPYSLGFDLIIQGLIPFASRFMNFPEHLVHKPATMLTVPGLDKKHSSLRELSFEIKTR
jgi:hypothetical protein